MKSIQSFGLGVLLLLTAGVSCAAKPCSRNEACFAWVGTSHVGWAGGRDYGHSQASANVLTVNGTRITCRHSSYVGNSWTVIAPIPDPGRILGDSTPITFETSGLNLRGVAYQLRYYPVNGAPVSVCSGQLTDDHHETVLCNVNLPIESLDADIARKMTALMTEIAGLESRRSNGILSAPSLRSELTTLEQDIENLIARGRALREAAARLRQTDFQAITQEELAFLFSEHPDLRSSFDRLRTSADQISSEIARETVSTQAHGHQVLENLRRQFLDSGSVDRTMVFTPEQTSANLSGEFVASASSTAVQDAVPTIAPLLPEAQTMGHLEQAIRRGDSRGFVMSFALWNRNHEQYVASLRSSRASTGALHAANQAHQRVVDFAGSQLDPFGFFTNSPVSGGVRQVVGEQIRNWNESYSRDLTEELNTWQGSLNPTQLRLSEEITQLGEVLSKSSSPEAQAGSDDPVRGAVQSVLKAALEEGTEKLILASRGAASSPESEQETLQQAHVGIQIAKVFVDFLIGISPAGSFKDLYEGLTGISLVSRESMSLQERALATTSGLLGLSTLGSTQSIKVALKSLAGIGRRCRLPKASGVGVARTQGIATVVAELEHLVATSKALESAPGISSLFATSEKALEHFAKHGKGLGTALGESSYSFAKYMEDANHTIKHGQYVPEKSAYVRLIGGVGEKAKYAFVGVDRESNVITTFHVKYVTELVREAPSLGFLR